jgi:predicted esterase
LLLLHGLGDTEANYKQLAEKFKLPQTAVMVLRAPLTLPFDLPGFAWFPSFGDDGSPLGGPGDTRRTVGLARTRALLCRLVTALTVAGWPLERIHLMGFSQGAVVATDLALRHALPGRFGSVVALSGCLLEEDDLAIEHDTPEIPFNPRALQTPLLVTHGTTDPRAPLGVAQRHAESLRMLGLGVEWRTYDKGHEMLRGPAEGRDLFAFLAQHLHLRDRGLEALEAQGELLEIAPGSASLTRVEE